MRATSLLKGELCSPTTRGTNGPRNPPQHPRAEQLSPARPRTSRPETVAPASLGTQGSARAKGR